MITKLINALTILRILLAVLIFMLLIIKDGYFLALILFCFAGVTDYLDGYFARKYNASSVLGEILDPIADKVLIIFILFALAVNLNSYLIAFLGAIIISREILVSALRDYNSRNNNTGATKVTNLAKIKTTFQLFTILIYISGLAFNIMLLILVADLFLITSVLITVYTGYIYTFESFRNKKFL
tara:strand:+ start:627 stop:1178 length:552 start_codon:yes stop_codon:yes gene_type:complete